MEIVSTQALRNQMPIQSRCQISSYNLGRSNGQVVENFGFLSSFDPSVGKSALFWDIAFSADSQYAITASSDGTARLWSIETSEIAKEYIGHQKALTSLAFQDGTP